MERNASRRALTPVSEESSRGVERAEAELLDLCEEDTHEQTVEVASLLPSLLPSGSEDEEEHGAEENSGEGAEAKAAEVQQAPEAEEAQAELPVAKIEVDGGASEPDECRADESPVSSAGAAKAGPEATQESAPPPLMFHDDLTALLHPVPLNSHQVGIGEEGIMSGAGDLADELRTALAQVVEEAKAYLAAEQQAEDVRQEEAAVSPATSAPEEASPVEAQGAGSASAFAGWRQEEGSPPREVAAAVCRDVIRKSLDKRPELLAGEEGGAAAGAARDGGEAGSVEVPAPALEQPQVEANVPQAGQCDERPGQPAAAVASEPSDAGSVEDEEKGEKEGAEEEQEEPNEPEEPEEESGKDGKATGVDGHMQAGESLKSVEAVEAEGRVQASEPSETGEAADVHAEGRLQASEPSETGEAADVHAEGRVQDSEPSEIGQAADADGRVQASEPSEIGQAADADGRVQASEPSETGEAADAEGRVQASEPSEIGEAPDAEGRTQGTEPSETEGHMQASEPSEAGEAADSEGERLQSEAASAPGGAVSGSKTEEQPREGEEEGQDQQEGEEQEEGAVASSAAEGATTSLPAGSPRSSGQGETSDEPEGCGPEASKAGAREPAVAEEGLPAEDPCPATQLGEPEGPREVEAPTQFYIGDEASVKSEGDEGAAAGPPAGVEGVAQDAPASEPGTDGADDADMALVGMSLEQEMQENSLEATAGTSLQQEVHDSLAFEEAAGAGPRPLQLGSPSDAVEEDEELVEEEELAKKALEENRELVEEGLDEKEGLEENEDLNGEEGENDAKEDEEEEEEEAAAEEDEQRAMEPRGEQVDDAGEEGEEQGAAEIGEVEEAKAAEAEEEPKDDEVEQEGGRDDGEEAGLQDEEEVPQELAGGAPKDATQAEASGAPLVLQQPAMSPEPARGRLGCQQGEAAAEAEGWTLQWTPARAAGEAGLDGTEVEAASQSCGAEAGVQAKPADAGCKRPPPSCCKTVGVPTQPLVSKAAVLTGLQRATCLTIGATCAMFSAVELAWRLGPEPEPFY